MFFVTVCICSLQIQIVQKKKLLFFCTQKHNSKLFWLFLSNSCFCETKFTTTFIKDNSENKKVWYFNFFFIFLSETCPRKFVQNEFLEELVQKTNTDFCVQNPPKKHAYKNEYSHAEHLFYLRCCTKKTSFCYWQKLIIMGQTFKKNVFVLFCWNFYSNVFLFGNWWRLFSSIFK